MNLINDMSRVELKAMRDGYGEMITNIGADERIVVLTADLKESLKVDEFFKVFPERGIELGIAEQNMMGIATGLANEGMIPIVNSIACFSPGRNWEQLRLSVGFNKANVKIVGGHGGVGNGVDGGNQQMYEDLAIVRVIPNMTVICPADAEQVKKAAWAMVEYEGPVYMRITKPKRAVVTTKLTPFQIGTAQVFKEGEDVSVYACGGMVYEAMLVAEKLLEKGVRVEVVNIHTIKPLDRETIIRSAKKTRRVVVAEEHQINGGLAGAVAEVLAEECPTRMVRVGMKDRFGESGQPEELVKEFGLTAREIEKAIGKLMEQV